MYFRFVTRDLFRHRQRVRRAERIVVNDKIQTSLAYDRFRREVLASPTTLAASAALGFCFDRRQKGSGEHGRGPVGRFSSLVTLALWARQIFS